MSQDSLERGRALGREIEEDTLRGATELKDIASEAIDKEIGPDRARRAPINDKTQTYHFENDPSLNYTKGGNKVLLREEIRPGHEKPLPWTVMGPNLDKGTVILERDGVTKEILNSDKYLWKEEK